MVTGVIGPLVFAREPPPLGFARDAPFGFAHWHASSGTVDLVRAVAARLGGTARQIVRVPPPQRGESTETPIIAAQVLLVLSFATKQISSTEARVSFEKVTDQATHCHVRYEHGALEGCSRQWRRDAQCEPLLDRGPLCQLGSKGKGPWPRVNRGKGKGPWTSKTSADSSERGSEGGSIP